MAKGRLFDCVALYHPAPKKDAQGNEQELKSEILIATKSILATSEQQAGMMMARLIPEEYVDKLDNVEVLIRPF